MRYWRSIAARPNERSRVLIPRESGVSIFEFRFELWDTHQSAARRFLGVTIGTGTAFVRLAMQNPKSSGRGLHLKPEGSQLVTRHFLLADGHDRLAEGREVFGSCCVHVVDCYLLDF